MQKNRILSKFGVSSDSFKDFDLRQGRIFHVGYDEGVYYFQNTVGSYDQNVFYSDCANDLIAQLEEALSETELPA